MEYCDIMDMALEAIAHVASSTERQLGVLQDPIPDDIFQAALAASQHDDDGENPFGPQPKRFMQTEHQKRQQKRDLHIRQAAWILRKMKRNYEARRQSLKKQKQRPSPFQTLPTELILKLMQHVYLPDLHDLVNSSVINRHIFRVNETAIYRGIETEQFSDWKWLFGDTTQRTSAQLQHLKDAVSTEYHFGASGSEYMERFLQVLRLIDNENFADMQYLSFLQHMQDVVDMDMSATESYTKKKIARRTAMCLRSLSFQRSQVVKEEDLVKNGLLVEIQTLPWEARSQLVIEQPASIQAEIRSIFMIVVKRVYKPLEKTLIWWTWHHYSSPGTHRNPEEVKNWLSKIVTGLILDEVIPQWYSERMDSETLLSIDWDSPVPGVVSSLIEALDGHNSGTMDVLQEIEYVVEFGRRIGLDLQGLVEGTEAGNLVDELGLNQDTEA